MKKLGIILAIYYLIQSVCFAQVQVAPDPDFFAGHPLLSRLVLWYRVMPGKYGGLTWYPLVGRFNATLTNGALFVPTKDTLGIGEVSLDGSDDYVNVVNDTSLDFANTTFTVSVRFRTTTTALGYLVSRRLGTSCSSSCGGYILRMDATTGILRARILESANINAGERLTNNAYNDGKPHRFTAIITTDTVTAANNDVSLYVDGKQDQTTKTAGTNPYFVCSTSCPLVFGSISDNQVGNNFAGTMDDVMIFNGALSAQEIQALDMIDVGWDVLPSQYDLLPLIQAIAARVKHKVIQR